MSPLLTTAGSRAYGLNAFAALGAYESIATATGTGSSATITFSSIPSTYSHLQIRLLAKSTFAQQSGSGLNMQFNSDTGSNYSWHYIYAGGGTTQAAGAANQTQMFAGMCLNTNGLLDNMMGVTIIDIVDYASTSKFKTVKAFTGINANGVFNNGQYMYTMSNLWRSTNAITSISLITNNGNWTTSTQFALYGIKGA